MSEHLTIILLTYKRTEYTVRTVQAVWEKLRYPNWGWYISDDGSSGEHYTSIKQACWAANHPLVGCHSEAISYGSGANAALDAAFAQGQLVLMLEDDWELTQPLDIWKYAALLMERPDIGMVRMGYLNNGLSGTLIDHKGNLYWNLDDTQSKHHSIMAFAGHPAIIHKRYFEAYGDYPEKWQPGETELRMAWQFAAEPVGPAIVWPAELGAAGPWAHIGGIQSYDWNGGVKLD